ncbi:GerAB/ArcD/ProY family transporter [Lysinibacillus sp. NPDC097162]|uniref:GerAB/ArcD/ProY family transporter n=1 Tax=Lysinibacillus sp. NPDC097162 TaxID=3364140 RepID=UPI003811206F
MSRYLYYFILVTMVTNLIASVPRILMRDSKDGVILSMIIAVILGAILTIIVINLFSYFPNKSFPEIMKESTPKWFYYPVLFYFACSWFAAGLITLTTYVFMFNTFLSYETSITITTLAFLLVISFGLFIKEKSVLYMTELILIIFLPVIIFLIIKIYTEPKLEWDFVKIAFTYINDYPSYNSFSASTYIFIGAVNIIIFNKYIKIKKKAGLKQFAILGIVGAFTLFTTYFIPIGFNGFEQIENLTFLWITTSDSVRMKYSLIERVTFLFVIVFIAVAFISLLIHWYVSLKLFESIFHFKKLKWKETNLTPFLVVLLFGLIALATTRVINEFELVKLSMLFYDLLPLFYGVLIVSLLTAKRRLKL